MANVELKQTITLNGSGENYRWPTTGTYTTNGVYGTSMEWYATCNYTKSGDYYKIGPINLYAKINQKTLIERSSSSNPSLVYTNFSATSSSCSIENSFSITSLQKLATFGSAGSDIYAGDYYNDQFKEGTIKTKEPPGNIIFKVYYKDSVYVEGYDTYSFKIDILVRAKGTLKHTYTVTYKNNNKEYKKDTYDAGSPAFVTKDIPPGGGTSTKYDNFDIIFDPKGGNWDGSTKSISKQYTASQEVNTTFLSWGNYPAGAQITASIQKNYELAANWDIKSGPWVYQTLNVPNNPTRTGYTFNGWKPQAISGSSVTKPQTYDAQWTANTSTAYFDGKGSYVGIGTNWTTTGSKQATYGSTFTFPKWSINSNGTNTTKKTIPKKWTVAFNPNEPGNGNINKSSNKESTDKNYYEEYAFDGWKRGNKTYGSQEQVTWNITDSIANFEAKYHIKSTSTLNPSAVNVPTLINPVGYTFDGWYTAKSGGKKCTITSGKYTPNANDVDLSKDTINLYAHWAPIKRAVRWKYYYDDGNKLEESSNTYTIETTLSVPAPPASKTMGVDYTFYGWTYGENSSAGGLGDWTQRKGVYSRPSELPFKGVDVSAPKTFNGKKLTDYRNWGQYPKGYKSGGKDLTGQIIPSTDTKNYVDITQYLFGCWIVTGKYVKIKEGNTSTYKKINSIFVKLENGSWKEIEDVYYRTTSGWKREIGKKEVD